jgi:hypothetical protein
LKSSVLLLVGFVWKAQFYTLVSNLINKLFYSVFL